MKECFRQMRLSLSSLDVIEKANSIIEEYSAQGLDLTLRQLYYQFVTKNWISNTERSYKQLGDIISNGRLAGLIDWEAITDRGRIIRRQTHWESPAEIVAACIRSFSLDKWEGQETRCEVWIEKDALSGVLDACCPALDVPYFACKGYVSQSAMYEAAQRIQNRLGSCRRYIIFHLGDHDPSGIDMSRDIRDRLNEFSSKAIEVHRIALNMDQINRYKPPPNPAKMTDARASDYVEKFGKSSWELDALEPGVLVDLIRKSVLAVRNDRLYRKVLDREKAGKETLRKLAAKA